MRVRELGRALFFLVAVALYLLMTTLSEDEIMLSGKDLFDAGYGSLLAALLVFFAMPRLLYRNRYAQFAIFCIVSVVVFTLAEEFLFDSIVMAADDPRRAVTTTGLRWAALNATFASFSIAAMVAMFDNLESRRRLSAVSELQKEAELAALKSQLSPHMLLNTLNNLYSLALERNEKTPDALLMLSHLLRYSVYEAEVETAPLEREIEVLRFYIALQELGIGERAEIDLEVVGVPEDRRIAPLLLLPIVENAFKHGAAVVGDQPSRISFRLAIAARSIRFEASNPFDRRESRGAPGGGVGLGNLKTRLELVYPHRHAFSIRTEENVCRVVLTVEGEPS